MRKETGGDGKVRKETGSWRENEKGDGEREGNYNVVLHRLVRGEGGGEEAVGRMRKETGRATGREKRLEGEGRDVVLNALYEQAREFSRV